jgi:hypothetical protein
MPSPTSAEVAGQARRVVLPTSAVSARIPPSPWLSARMMRITYLIETISVIVQKTSDMTP